MENTKYSSLIQDDQIKSTSDAVQNEGPEYDAYQAGYNAGYAAAKDVFQPDVIAVDELDELGDMLKAVGFTYRSMFVNLAYDSEPSDPKILEYTGHNLDLFLESVADKLAAIVEKLDHNVKGIQDGEE